MENPKKRSDSSSKSKSNKKAKIETAADAVRALDDIVLDPFPLHLCTGPASGSTKLPDNFFKNRKRMMLSNIGEVYSTGGMVNRIPLPLTDDLRSLIESHERWEVVAHKLRDKCMELKHQIENFWQVSPPPLK